jgi:predicted enzyme related to lactoylglutathione lyase
MTPEAPVMTAPTTTTEKADKATKKAKKLKIKKSSLPRKAAYFILYVPDMAKAIEFYKNTLHMKVGFESPEWTEIKAGIKFALHGTKAEGFTPVKTGLVFGVKNAQTSYEIFNHLGVKTLGAPVQVCEDGRSFCFEDPFGNQLSCYGK